MPEYVLEMQHISKSFPGVRALDNVNLHVRRGTVHVIVGENGAGKSTLVKVLSGLHLPDEGRILIDNQQVIIRSPTQALEQGISIIQQELPCAPDLTVAESLFLNREPHRVAKWFVDYKAMYEKAQAILNERQLNLDAATKMKNLSIAQKQMVEIAKAVSFNARVIIMDEPTSAISEAEVEALFSTIRELTENGVSIIYISHKMEELERIADDVTVLRDGKYMGTKPMAELTRDKIISLMVGRDITNRYPKESVELGGTALEVTNLHSGKAVKNMSFRVRAGEILGIAGLMGAGRTEVARAIFGMDRKDGGDIEVNGQAVSIKSPTDAIRAGIAMVSEDRRRYGVVLCRSILENISLPNLGMFRRWYGIDKRSETREVAGYYKRLSIKSPTMDTVTNNLSGGNQQKVVLAKWLMSRPKVLIMDEPTRGIDVGAKYEIYRLMSEMVREGMAIVFISSELPELLGMSDRILVMALGEAVALIDRADATQENIMRYATGSSKMSMEEIA